MMRSSFLSSLRLLSCLVLIVILSAALDAFGQGRPPRPPATPGPMLKDGTQDYDAGDFTLTLVKSSQTVAALKPKSSTDGFDFTPGDILVERSQDGYYHLGDIDLRLRTPGGEWKSYSTALERHPVTPSPSGVGVIAGADLGPTLPADIPLSVTRYWTTKNRRLALRFVLKNKSDAPVEIGGLGIPMVFNNVLNNRTLDQAHAVCSFYDPYIGEDAGYLQVTRLSGHGPALLVVPDFNAPFEAYNPIVNPRRGRPPEQGQPPAPPQPQIFTDRTPRGVTFEGFYDWMIYSKAFAENEWKNAEPWNPATSITLKPGEERTVGVRFLVADEIRNIEKTLAENGRPVAVGVPGYIVPTDIEARLFLQYPKGVKSIAVEPAGVLTWTKDAAPNKEWKAYTVRGKTWGRARMTVTYDDGLVQTIQYRVIKPEPEVVNDMGRFLTTKQWFEDTKDPFRRAPSVMTYDRDVNQIVMQDSRVWIAGLSDEGGAGSWLSAMMKEIVEPNREEIAKLETFVDNVLWGGIQYKDGERQYGVRKSLFYFAPDEFGADFYRKDLNWTSWTSWKKPDAEKTDRSFNYPHVAAAHWVMYRLARNHKDLVTNHPWDWYLQRAYETSIAMVKFGPGYARFGQMEGDIFLDILRDLRREKMTEQADKLEATMRARADRWKAEAYPFGSEMPWDSTGQEEVYAWTKYFGYQDKAEVTLNAVLGYMPTVPHWGYNGSARRYWDFIYGAKLGGGVERQLHHYGSGINAIPVLSEYRDHPDDFYLLRVGYGGTMGAITNIDQDGFASAAFHSFPGNLKFDALSGDYGPNFFGHAWNTATYVVKHPEFGWLALGGNVTVKGNTVRITTLDSSRNRVYIASLGLWLTLDAGTFDSVEVNSGTGAVRVALSKADAFTPEAHLRIEQPAAIAGVGKYHPSRQLRMEREAYVVPLAAQATWVDLTAKP